MKIEISPCFGYERLVTWAIHTPKQRGCNIIKAIIYELGEGMSGLERGAKPNRNGVYAGERARRR